MEAIEGIKNLSYALDTFYFLITGALVMWMAAGFAMLEAGLVRSKNTAEILTKNIVLFAIAGIKCTNPLEGQICHSPSAICCAVDTLIMNHDERPILSPLNVHLDPVGACRYRALEGG